MISSATTFTRTETFVPTKPAAALARAGIEATKAIGTIWSCLHERARDIGTAPAMKRRSVSGESPGGCAKPIHWGQSGGGKLDGHTSIVQYPLGFLGRCPRVVAVPSHAWGRPPVASGGAASALSAGVDVDARHPAVAFDQVGVADDHAALALIGRDLDEHALAGPDIEGPVVDKDRGSVVRNTTRAAQQAGQRRDRTAKRSNVHTSGIGARRAQLKPARRRSRQASRGWSGEALRACRRPAPIPQIAHLATDTAPPPLYPPAPDGDQITHISRS